MRKRLWLFPILFIGLLVAAPPGQGQPPTPPSGAKQTFAWKFTPGNRLQMEITTDLKQVIRVTNQEELRQEQRMTLLSTYVVAQKDADSCVLEQTITSVKVQTPTGAAPGKFYQQLEGAKLRLTLTNKDRELRLEGYEDLLKKVAGDDPNVRRVVQSLLPEETLRRSLEESFAFLPAEPVAPGESWERKYTAGLGPLGSLNIVNVYTYEKAEMDGNQLLHRISVQPKISYSPPKADTTGLPFQIPSGEIRAEEAGGSLLWSTSEGRLVRSDMKLKLVGKLKIKAKDQEANMELESEQTVEIRAARPTNGT